MRALFCALLLATAGTASSQSTTTIDVYCTMTDSYPDMNGAIQYLPDSLRRMLNVRPKESGSTIDILNFYSLQGWKLVNSYPVVRTLGTSDTISETHYLLQRTLTVDTATAAWIRQRVAENSKPGR